ncbi:MAG: ribosome maturation factor RimP [Acidimicrobiales bacterium]
MARLVPPLLEPRGLHLYDVEHAGGTLRVLVDRSGGVDLDLLAEVTRELSSALDAVDPVPGRYTLEVSSPGLERPLRRPDHFSAAVGNRVRVKTSRGTEGDRRVEGTLVAADDEGIAIEEEGGLRRLRYAEVERARTVFEWEPAGRRPTPSRGKATTS